MSNTSEEALFTRKQLITLIWPLMLEQLLNVSMGFADTFMVSGVGEAAVSSVSLVDSINILIIQVLASLATGGAVVVSQYLGKKEEKNAQHSATQLYVVLGGITLMIMGIVLLFSRMILRSIFGKIDSQVMDFANTYFLISAVSYPFMGFYNAGAALFRAQGNSKISMKASLVMNVVNVTGNAWLIYGVKLGVLGAAIATLTGRVVAAVWALVQQQKQRNLLRISDYRNLIPDLKVIRTILNIGIPAGIENGMFHIGKLCVSSLVSTLGTAEIAANAVAGSIATLMGIPGNTMSLASIPDVGRCLGAGEKAQAKRYGNFIMKIAMIGFAMINIGFIIFIPIAVGCFHLSDEATNSCIRIIFLHNVLSIFFWAPSFVLPNILRSGGDAKFTMCISIVSMWFCRVALSYYLVSQTQMGLMGVWTGMFIDWSVRSVFFAARYYSGKWMEHKVI